MTLFKVEVKGLMDAINKINTLYTDIDKITMLGMEKAGHMLKERIEEKEQSYANKVQVYADFSAGIIWIGPKTTYAPIREYGSTTGYVRYRCRWWKYLGGKIRMYVPKHPVLIPISQEYTDEIKNIIFNEVKNYVEQVIR